MFTTKKQIDQHVKTSLARLRNENEKRLRGLVIAKMYYKIGEYASAQHYVSGYLTANENTPPAHRLLGDCYIKLRQPEKALASYQRSLQLDARQTDLIIEACTLLANEDLDLTKCKAKYWCEMASAERVQHQSVFNLKLKLFTKTTEESSGTTTSDSKVVEEMILKEINNRPLEVHPRIQLINYFLERKRFADAFKYIGEVQAKSRTQFLDSIEWYSIVGRTLKLYKHAQQSKGDVLLSKDWDFWLLSVVAIERQLSLTLAIDHSLFAHQATNLIDCQNVLHEFDQLLQTVSGLSFTVRPELVVQLLLHFKGQFCLHLASYLFKRERVQNQNQWRQTTSNCLPLLLAAFHTGIADTEEPWLKQVPEATRELVRFWQRQGAFRCAQAGRTLLSCIATGDSSAAGASLFANVDDLCENVRKHCAAKNWRSSLYRGVFTNSDHLAAVTTSFFVTCHSLEEPICEVPTSLRLQMYERIARSLQSDSLSQLVYLYLHHDSLAECDFNLVQGLEFTAANIYNCNASTLNKLDMETFLLATIMQTRSQMAVDRMANVLDGDRPSFLPFTTQSRGLCTEEQSRWWTLAVRTTTAVATSDDVWDEREVLQDGIEAVRCLGHPKMDLMIALSVADVMRQKIDITMASEFTKKAYEQRVENICLCALHLLKNEATATLVDKRKLFRYQTVNGRSLSTEEVAQKQRLSEAALTFLADCYFRRGEWDSCIDQFNNVQQPFAMYYIAEAYKKMEDTTRTTRSPRTAYQDKVKEYLNKTQKLLTNGLTYKGHPLQDKVKNELRKVKYTDMNSSALSEDEVLGSSFSGGGSGLLNRSRRDDSVVSKVDSAVVDQVSNLTTLVTQLTIQNTMLQSELSDIKKMLQTKDEQASLLNESIYGQQQRAAAAAAASLLAGQHHQSPHYDYLNGSYGMSSAMGFPLQQYSGVPPFQATPTAYPGAAPHIRPGAHLYGGPDTLGMAQSTPHRGVFDPMLNLVPPMQQPPPNMYMQPPPIQTQQPQLQSTGYFSPQQQQTAPASLQQLPSLAATSTTLSNSSEIGQALAATNTNFMKAWNSTYNSNAGASMPPTTTTVTSTAGSVGTAAEKAAPVNVVITSSDPVPVYSTVTTQPLLSVTIPPQHIKNFGNGAAKEDNFPSTLATTMQQGGSFNYGQDESSASIALTHDATNISGDETATEEDGDYEGQNEYQEEESCSDEIIYFTGQATLCRFGDKDWQKGDSGELKIARNVCEDRIRLTMTDGQSRALLASHDLAGESKLVPNGTNEFTWTANDFALGTLKVGAKFRVKFNVPQMANGFREAFERATNEGAANAAAAVGIFARSAESNSTPPKAAAPAVAPSPTVAAPVAAAATTGEATKPNPFATFTFGGSATSDTTKAADKPFSSLFNNLPKPTFSGSLFGQTVVAAAPAPATTAFAQETKTSGEGALNTSAHDGGDDDYVPTATFKPVIELPSLVEVKTGEEDENVAFEHRAKLLRFDVSTKEWKERGLGNIRVLVRKDDPSQARLLMRREQVLKLACNQRLLKDQVFKKMPNSETALSWSAHDYADDEPKLEMFAIRFKTSDICRSFHDAILEVQRNMVAPVGGTKQTPVAAVADGKAKAEEPKQGFGDAFKPQVGSWECKMCYIRNKGDAQHCVACDAPKDDTVPKKKETAAPAGLDLTKMASNKFSFGMPTATTTTTATAAAKATPAAATATPALAPKVNGGSATTAVTGADTAKGFGDAFKPKVGSWECTGCYVRNQADVLHCMSCETPKDDTVPQKEAKSFFGSNTTGTSTFKFGITTPASTSTIATSTTSTFSFGTTLTSAASTAAATTTTTTLGSGSFFGKLAETTTNGNGDTASPFNFVFKPKSPGAKGKSPNKLTNGVESAKEVASDDENVEEEENTTYFQPVIALPNKVDAKTGEEEEESLYSHRAKLYRFADGEWRERGLGDIKILKHKETGKLRVVMRREQVLKICLNHMLDNDVVYKAKDSKSWQFGVNDFSEGVLEPMQFSIRFKTPPIAEEFMAAVERARKDLPQSPAKKTLATGEAAAPVLVEEKQPTEGESKQQLSDEERKMLLDLRLSPDFFDYKSKAPCPGCRGCNDAVDFEYGVVNPEVEPEDMKPLLLDIPKQRPKVQPMNVFAAFNQSLSLDTSAQANVFSPQTIFGGAAQGAEAKAAPTFGSSTFSFGSGANVFGQAASPAKGSGDATSGLFAGFGSSPAPAAAATPSTPASTGNIFGGGGFGMTPPSTMFGGAAPPKNDASKTMFGGGMTLFGGGSTNMSSFNFSADTLKTDTTTTNGKTDSGAALEPGVNIFKMDAGLDFAALAQQSGSTEEKPFSKTGTGQGGFFGLSHTQDFKHFQSTFKNGVSADESHENAEDPNYDPHYEPIIQLPEEIVVSTGEEEEAKVFGERAKLFRFDSTTKEWKERGVGELKILHHPGRNTYRFVMRREQIFMLVLNHSIGPDFKFTMLDKSGKAYSWAAMNFVEDNAEVEQLAVRFGNVDIASRFERTLNECISKAVPSQ